MTALKSLETKTLYDEISTVPFIEGKRISLLYDFLSARGISSLSEVTVKDLEAFIHYVKRSFPFDKAKYSAYKGDLENVLFTYMKNTGASLSLATPFSDSPRGRKALIYLYASKIDSFKGITAYLRTEYSEYLTLSVPSKHSEYLKQLDLMALSEIESSPFTKTPIYKNELFYLGYYPVITIAKRFYFTQKKDFLYFDFSAAAPTLAKKQIFQMLINDLTEKARLSNHLLIQHFITPLYYLLKFVIEFQIADIKKITATEEQLFSDYLKRNMASYNKNASQVLYRVRRFLFLTEEKPDFESYTWFLDRFDLGARVNPTSETESFYFGDIAEGDREIFMHYMKYLLVLSPKYSMRSLLDRYYASKEFIFFIERRRSCLTELSYSDIENFIDYKDKQDLKPESYNKSLLMLSFFLTVLSVREKLLIPSFPFDYFLKKEIHAHHDRSVKEETIDRILSVLPYFPETLGLMFLTLYSTGLRINEVCSLKKDALKSGNGLWLKVYQYKMKADKEIPIPEELFRLLKRHILSDTSGSEFIFPSCTDINKPFKTVTFSRQMKKELLLYDETKDIHFKSHDFRHTIATDIHMSGAPLQATRAFLGHVSEDMTKQYIDHLPGQIDMLQDKYFKEKYS